MHAALPRPGQFTGHLRAAFCQVIRLIICLCRIIVVKVAPDQRDQVGKIAA